MRLFVILASACLGACQGSESPKTASELSPMLVRRPDGAIIASAESLRTIPGYRVDSIFPPAEALRRFREESGATQPTALEGGDTSVVSLLTGYVAALRVRDSISVLRYALTRQEYAWLYYDGSPEQQSGLVPQAAWALMESRSNVGLGRAAGRVSAVANARVVEAKCGATTAKIPGAELIGPCTVTLEAGNKTRTTVPLARSVMRHNGRLKLVSFANDL